MSFSKFALVDQLPLDMPVFFDLCLMKSKYLKHNYKDIEEVIDTYKSFYSDSSFIKITEDQEFPKVSEISLTNNCSISLHQVESGDGVNLVILSAIDNLIKGASGQAVQNMNIMFDMDEKISLV